MGMAEAKVVAVVEDMIVIVEDMIVTVDTIVIVVTIVTVDMGGQGHEAVTGVAHPPLAAPLDVPDPLGPAAEINDFPPINIVHTEQKTSPTNMSGLARSKL